MLPISTTAVKAVAESTAKKTLGTTAKAAVIGGLINGSDGAKVGLGVSILTRGNSVDFPAVTMLEFQLKSPFTVK